MKVRTCLAVLAGCLGATAAPAAADTEIGPAGGPRIYLSTACHDRGSGACQPNFGCDGYDENLGSDNIARPLSEELAKRGYRVRVGTGLTAQNIAASNAFNSVIHMPLHSNAAGTGNCGGGGGTQVLHYGGPGDDELANILVEEVGPKSPGGGDTAVVRRDLGEITETSARVAYMESEFHTSPAGVAFLRDPQSWVGSIADGVDRCLGRNGRAKECSW